MTFPPTSLLLSRMERTTWFRGMPKARSLLGSTSCNWISPPPKLGESVTAETERLRAAGISVDGPHEMARSRPDGESVEWQLAFVGDGEQKTTACRDLQHPFQADLIHHWRTPLSLDARAARPRCPRREARSPRTRAAALPRSRRLPISLT